MKNPVQIINEIDAIFNPNGAASPQTTRERLDRIRSEVGEDMFMACWIMAHTVAACTLATYRDRSTQN